MERRLVFLLGSGVSRAATMPSVAEITAVVLSGVRNSQPYKKFTDELYYNSPTVVNFDPDAMTSVIHFLKGLRRRCEGYFGRGIDYEDIAYLVWQVHDQQSGNYENAALVPLIRLLRRRSQGKELLTLASEAQAYIHCVVRDMLSKAPASLGHVPCLTEASRTGMFDCVDVFTLNHDTLLEQELTFANVAFTDGFNLETDTCSYWDGQAFANPKHSVRLGKLHGSIDWYRYNPDSINPTRTMVGKPNGRDCWHTCNLTGQLQRPLGGESVMLIGNFNKILDYTGGIFADLFCAFRAALQDTRYLVISGYGFRDKGVNQTIIEWLRGSSNRKLGIIHPDYLTYERDARKAIKDLFRTNHSQIFGISKWFQYACFADLQSGLLN